MSRVVPLLLLFLLLPTTTPGSENWAVKTGDHFLVHHRNSPIFAAEVLREAERLYGRINSDLGLDRAVGRNHLSFWLWDDRCRIYLHPDHETYRRATGAPAWSAGSADYRSRVVHSYDGAEGFVSSTLPHELTHILFRDFVGHDNPDVPLWLDEGVAQYAETDRRSAGLEALRDSVSRGRYLPFAVFHTLDPRRTDGETARFFYLQAVGVVHFLIETQGRGRFVDFLGNLRDGYPVGRALSFATGGRIGSLEELETAWVRSVR